MPAEYARIAAFVLPLGLDTLAVAIALGLRGIRPLKPAIVFSIFEGTMPLAGAVLGLLVSARYATAAIYLGAAALVGMGLHAIREAGDIVEEAERFDLTGWRSTVLAGFAISTDELVFGFPLGATGLSILPVLCVIAVQAFIVVFVGVALGHWMSSRVSQLAGTAAGIAFIGLGAYLVLEHIFIVP